MACQPSHRRPSRVRPDEQGFEPRRADVPPRAYRIITAQTTTVAGSAGQATGARYATRHAGANVKHRILVVEDNALNRELLCDWLESEGHEVVSVEDLRAAFRTLENEQPDAVLLDVQLVMRMVYPWPRGCGSSQTVSYPGDRGDRARLVTEHQRFLQAGCNACISKPVNFKLLSEQLERWLNSRWKSPSAPK